MVLFCHKFEFNQWVFVFIAVQQCQILCSKQIVICRQILCCKGMDTLMHFMLTGLVLLSMFNLVVRNKVLCIHIDSSFCYHLYSSFKSLSYGLKNLAVTMQLLWWHLTHPYIHQQPTKLLLIMDRLSRLHQYRAKMMWLQTS